MKKRDFFLAAMQAEEYKRTAFVISAFSLISEDPNEWRKNPYPYRIVQTPTGHFFVNPNNIEELIKIEDTGLTPFSFNDVIELKAGELPNLNKDITTTYGNVLFNYIVVIYPFGKKIEFVEGQVTTGKMESMIVQRLKDNPEKPEDRLETEIYVDEYLKFTDAMFSLCAYTQLCVPACSPKSITAPPGIRELRDRLLEENKDKLHDPVVVATIEKALVKHLKEWMKDDPAMGFLIKDKSFSNVRRKLHIMNGMEFGMNDDDPEGVLVPKSLSEGWDPQYFAAMNTSSRSGSFSRGALTQLGGEATKWLFRASSNMTATIEDCGSKVGVEMMAKKGEEGKLVGFTAIISESGKATSFEKIDEENVEQYLGRKLYLRSPMYCLSPKTDYCKICVGDKLATNPTGLSTAIAEYGSVFLTTSLKSMHDTSLVLRKMSVDEVLF